MWALRRASNPLKAFSSGSFRGGSTEIEIASCYLEENAGLVDLKQVTFDRFVSLKRYHHSRFDFSKPFVGRQHFSSPAGMKSSGEEDDDLEDGFSELETPAIADATQARNVAQEDDELISGSEVSEEEENGDDIAGLEKESELSDTEADLSEKRFSPTKASSRLFNAIMNASGLSIKKVLDKWVEEGNDLNRDDISRLMLNFRKRWMYWKALQLSEWLESSKLFDFSERDYASRLDLISKLRGLQKAEWFIEMVPKSFRGEIIYRTLLANCVIALNVRKAEEVFKKMKELQFTITPFTFNQLLLLYKRTDKKKIADVLLLMEKENVEPTIFTYNILIDAKGQSQDIIGMDQVVETMRDWGIEPGIHTQSLLAKHYVSCGLRERAEAVMKEMEGDDLNENRAACRPLLLLNASLGKTDEVSRIWKVCQTDLNVGQCVAAIEAWGKLNKVEEAEAVFEMMLKRWKKLSSKNYSVLLKTYANRKMLAKGKDLVKRMAGSGCCIGPPTWDALVKLYLEAGEVEKADSILLKAAQENRMKPMFNSFMAIMEQYSKKGDVHNTEKMFYRMGQIGYFPNFRQFQCLMKAYMNANSPAYGMRERMMAANIFPDRAPGMLAQIDPFKKTAVSQLLD